MRSRVRPILAFVATLAALTWIPLHAQAQPGTTQFDLPAQPLAQSLRAVASATNMNVLFDTLEIADLQAPALKGRITIDEALARLLAGSGFKARHLDDKTIVLASSKQSAGMAPGADATDSPAAAMRLAQTGNRAGSTTLAAANPRADEEKKTDEDRSAAGDSRARGTTRSSSDVQIQEIVVTAQKREERLIEVPQSVQVLAAEELTKSGAVKFVDYAKNVPGLSFTSFGSGNKAVLRGITTYGDSSTTTAQYVDEVPYGSGSSYGDNYYMIDVALFDLDRIEVLKGPQGTLYGVSSLGGLIKYVTKRPDTKAFAGEAQVGFAGTEKGAPSYNGAVAFNVPLVADKLAFRASAYYNHDGGFVDNIPQNKKDINDTDIKGARFDLLYTPTERLGIRFNAFLQDLERGGQPFVDYTANGSGPRYGDLKQVRIYPEFVDQRFYLLSNTITYDFDWATLTSVTGYQQQNKSMAIDYSNYYGAILAGLGRTYSQVGVAFWDHDRVFTEEVRLASRGQNKLDWVLGAFYTDETVFVVDKFRLKDAVGNPAVNDLFDYQAPSGYRERAVFGDLTWHITDKFDVTGGIRVARNKVHTENNGSGLFIVPRPYTSSNGKATTYLANARYKFNENSTGYVRYATGYRPGGPNFPEVDPNTGQQFGTPSFDADSLKSYEIGYKAETSDQRFAVDVNVYHIDWSNIQVIVYPFGFGIFVNAPGGATVNGAEMALAFAPTRNLTFSSGLAYTDAYMKDATPAIGALKDERLPISPRFTASLTADYQFPVERFQPTVGVGAHYISDRKTGFEHDASGNPLYIMPAYTTVDAHAGFKLGSVDTQLYIRNLTDKRGVLTAFTFNGIQPFLTTPRTIGVTASMRF